MSYAFLNKLCKPQVFRNVNKTTKRGLGESKAESGIKLQPETPYVSPNSTLGKLYSTKSINF